MFTSIVDGATASTWARFFPLDDSDDGNSDICDEQARIVQCDGCWNMQHAKEKTMGATRMQENVRKQDAGDDLWPYCVAVAVAV